MEGADARRTTIHRHERQETLKPFEMTIAPNNAETQSK